MLLELGRAQNSMHGWDGDNDGEKQYSEMLREDLTAKMAFYQIFEVLKSLTKRSFHAGNS